MEDRFKKNGLTLNGKWTGEIKVAEHLLSRFSVRAPKVFSIWNDPFIKGISDSEYGKIINAIQANPQHIYLFLTKRPERIPAAFSQLIGFRVMVGVTVEMSRYLNRIEELKSRWLGQKFLSAEPLLDAIPFDGHLDGIDWVIVGGESGPNKRACEPDRILNVVQQCKDSSIPVFVKQIHLDGRLSKNILEWPKELQFRETPKVPKASEYYGSLL